MGESGSLSPDTPQFRSVDVPRSFKRRPLSGGVAIEVTVRRMKLGVLWAGDDSESAGFIRRRDSGVAGKKIALTIESRLRVAHAEGEENVRAIQEIASSVSDASEPRRFTDFSDVAQELGRAPEL